MKWKYKIEVGACGLTLSLFVLSGLSWGTFRNRILIDSNLGGTSITANLRAHQCLGQDLVGMTGADTCTYWGIMYFRGFYDDLIPVLDQADLALPKEFKLHQNYPNPFNPMTTIRYEIPRACHVIITVYNLLGMEVASLVDEMKTAGFYQASWQASSVASGLYFYRIQADNFVQIRKMMIIK